MKTNIKFKLSIRLLVIALAFIGVTSNVLQGFLSSYHLSQLEVEQNSLINISSVQEASSKVSDALASFKNRQAQVLAAKKTISLDKLNNNSNTSELYQQASVSLNQTIGNNAELKLVIADLDSQYLAAELTDKQIYKTAKGLLLRQVQITQQSLIVDTLLNELDTLIGDISGKVNFKTKKLKRKIKRLLKKETQFEANPALVTRLIDNVRLTTVGKEEKLVGLVNSIQTDILKLSAQVRELINVHSIDAILNLRKNKIDQQIQQINMLVKDLSVSTKGDSVLAEINFKITKKVADFIAVSILSNSSIYELQFQQIKHKTILEKQVIASRIHASSIEATLSELTKSVLTSRDKLVKQSNMQIQSSYQLNLIITASILIALIIAAVYIVISINKPLSKISSALYGIAHGDGDLTQRLNTNGIKEISVIAENFNQFVEKIAHTIKDVDQSSANLFMASNTLKQISTKTRDEINNQQKETDNAAAAMTEMTKAANEIATNANSARSASENALDESSTSNELVKKVAADISLLAEKIEETSHSIVDLEKYSESIGSVLDVIGGIAEQTNLLALNAAIEAARAGEQGRGFAVVADEVRSLASRTQESTIEIENMIKQLQTRAQNSVVAIQDGNKNAQNSAQQASEAVQTIEKVNTAILSISQMNFAIASAAEQQSVVSVEINNNVMAISNISAQTVKGAEDISNSGQNLSEISTQLQHLLSQFKV